MQASKPIFTPEEARGIRRNALAWYDKYARALPWRADRPDPYHVWLSEIMLQQTTVPAVQNYFRRFIALWPDVHALAAAPESAVLKEWAGLGYYARARNLHKCARVVCACEEYQGRFPDNEAALLALPGIGPYTAAAIAAIAFERPAVVIDGNIERILARLRAIETPLPAGKKEIRKAGESLMSAQKHRPGAFAQALMDLGTSVCRPRGPLCMSCPLQDLCAGARKGIQNDLPRREKKAPKPERAGEVFFVFDGQGRILLHRRAGKGLLASMIALPSRGWDGSGVNDMDPGRLSVRDVTPVPGAEIRHVFTHFALRLIPYSGRLDPRRALPDGFFWAEITKLEDAGLPGLFRKAVPLIRDMDSG